MKKLIVGIILVGILAGGYWYLSQKARLTFEALEGKRTTVTRGDLVRPITASGKIEPANIVKVKGEASGIVVEAPFNEGAMVKKGDLIVRLDPQDEQRNVDSAQADYDRTEIALELAKLSLEQQSNEGLIMAEAHVLQAEARQLRAQVEYDHKIPLTQPSGGLPPPVNREEWEQVRAAKMEADAAVKAARGELAQAQRAVQQARLQIRTAEENLKAAQKRLEETKKHLSETKVLSPIDGMILSRDVQIGEPAQSGTKSLMGGTLLMSIADVSQIYAVVNVDEADIGEVRSVAPVSAVPGTPTTRLAEPRPGVFDQDETVDVTVESFPGEKFQGVIERIAPQSQLVAAIATFKVWIRITSPNREKLIGLLNTQAEARFSVKSVTNAVLVSYDAMKKNPEGEGYGVYTVVKTPQPGKPKYEFRLCKFGIDNGIDVEVLEGLEPGEEVYTVLPQMTQREREAQGSDDDDES